MSGMTPHGVNKRTGRPNLPQWSPLGMSGMTFKLADPLVSLSEPQWSPLGMSGMTGDPFAIGTFNCLPQWSPLGMSGMTRGRRARTGAPSRGRNGARSG